MAKGEIMMMKVERNMTPKTLAIQKPLELVGTAEAEMALKVLTVSSLGMMTMMMFQHLFKPKLVL